MHARDTSRMSGPNSSSTARKSPIPFSYKKGTLPLQKIGKEGTKLSCYIPEFSSPSTGIEASRAKLCPWKLCPWTSSSRPSSSSPESRSNPSSSKKNLYSFINKLWHHEKKYPQGNVSTKCRFLLHRTVVEISRHHVRCVDERHHLLLHLNHPGYLITSEKN